MNAKLAVAISLGASSLALFGMAGVANAETVTPPNSGTNPQPVVQAPQSGNANPSGNSGNENPQPGSTNQGGNSGQNQPGSTPAGQQVGGNSEGTKPEEKKNEAAEQAIKDAKSKSEDAQKDVTTADNEVKQANEKATEAKNTAEEAQNGLNAANKSKDKADKEKTEADNNLNAANNEVNAKEKVAEEAAGDVAAKDKALKDEQAKQTAAEEAKKKAENEQAAAEEEKKTAENNVTDKNTALEKAKGTLESKQDEKNDYDKKLKEAQEKLENEKKEQARLDDIADRAKTKQEQADLAVENNKKEQQEKQNKIDALNNPTTTTNEEVERLKREASEAEQKAKDAKEDEDKKDKEAKNKQNDLDNAGKNLNSAEDALEKNPDAKKLSDTEKAVKDAKNAADEAAKNASTTTANFDGFLDYVIKTYKNSTSKEDKALLADAQRAKQILNGERVEIMKQVQNGDKTENVLDRVEVPMWYKDLVKLGKVGGADSLQNMKEAATYYEALNKLRKEDSDKNSASTEDKATLGAVNVRLSLIAESIVNSFYSGANHDHAINHPGYKSSEVMKTNPYNATENLAWGNYDGDSKDHKNQEYGSCHITANGNTSCSVDSEKYNALSGWYTVEKERYDKAVEGTFVTGEKGSEVTHKISDAGKKVLKEHRYDLGRYMRQNPDTKLFESADDNSKLKGIFLESVGHYTNFASKDITAGGFAESDLSLQEVTTTTTVNGKSTVSKEDVVGDVAVWHGSNESSITIAKYKQLLANYESSLGESAKAELQENDAINKLNAEANKANYDLFVKKYELRKLHYDLNMSDANNLDAADAAKPEVGLQDQEKNALDVLKQKAQELVAYYSQTDVTWAATQETVNRLLSQAKSEVQKIESKITNITNSISTADSKKSEVEKLKKAVTNANTAFEQAKTDVQEANKALTQAQETANRLNTEATSAQQKYKEAEQKAQTAAQQTSEERNKQIQNLQGELDQLKEKAKTLEQTAKQAKTAADAAKMMLNFKRIRLMES